MNYLINLKTKVFAAILLLLGVTNAWGVTIEHIGGKTEINGIPERVVVLGHGSLDALNYLGVTPVGSLHSLLPDYLAKYKDLTVNSGSFHEPNLEALFTLKPDLIIIENRMSHMYEEISKIAPSILFYVEDGQYWQDTQKNWRMLGEIFAKQDVIERKIAETNSLFERAKKKTKQQGADALMVMNNGGKVTMYNEGSRFSIIFDEFGFRDASKNRVQNTAGTHGNLISFEYIFDAKPNVMFVLDRESAIGTNSGKAQAHFDNDLVNATPAGQSNKVIFIDPNAWYLTAGGITATEKIIADVYKAL